MKCKLKCRLPILGPHLKKSFAIPPLSSSPLTPPNKNFTMIHFSFYSLYFTVVKSKRKKKRFEFRIWFGMLNCKKKNFFFYSKDKRSLVAERSQSLKKYCLFFRGGGFIENFINRTVRSKKNFFYIFIFYF